MIILTYLLQLVVYVLVHTSGQNLQLDKQGVLMKPALGLWRLLNFESHYANNRIWKILEPVVF